MDFDATGTVRTLLAAAAAGVLLWGCATVSTFDGPEPPEEEMAILEGYWHFYFVAVSIVKITSLDGKPLFSASGDVTQVRMSPGRHRVGVQVLTAFGEIGVKGRCTFEAQLEAGHRYRIEAFDQSASESEIGLDLTTVYGGSARTRRIACRREAP